MEFFRERFGRRPEWVASAPGRVNLIGDHVDYQGGLVLPVATAERTVVAVARNGGGVTRVASAAYPEDGLVELTGGGERARPRWANYVFGVLHEYEYELGEGIDLAVWSTLPRGGGLSSSAALEVAVACAVEGVTGTRLPPVERALRCQRAEHAFAGVPCGIMDQLAVCCAREGGAMLIDCRSLEVVPVALPDGAVVQVADSGVRHELAASAYPERTAACAEAARRLGVGVLRDASEGAVARARGRLGKVLAARAGHVVSEIARVQEFVEAIGSGDLPRAGDAMSRSHGSLAEDFEVSCGEVDHLVGCFMRAGAYGARMTGGGFGGCVVALVDPGRASEIARETAEGYAAATGIRTQVRRVEPGGAARVTKGAGSPRP